MTIDHASLYVAQGVYQETLNLYLEALKPLGYEIRQQFGPTVTGMGSTDVAIEGYAPADFWLTGVEEAPNVKSHIAFRAKDRATVDAFHTAALKAGAKCNGAPGPRFYHPNYYGGFILDPAGNNIEAVCHEDA